jgi:hypothetical protein
MDGVFVITDDLTNDQKLILHYVYQGNMRRAEIDNVNVCKILMLPHL